MSVFQFLVLASMVATVLIANELARVLKQMRAEIEDLKRRLVLPR